jgi:hypothetical protein
MTSSKILRPNKLNRLSHRKFQGQGNGDMKRSLRSGPLEVLAFSIGQGQESGKVERRMKLKEKTPMGRGSGGQGAMFQPGMFVA